jgi:hypothetical protein
MDQFEKWKATGKLNEILDYIGECSRKLVTQHEMLVQLGIRDDTFSKMKRKHPEIQEAQDRARYSLKRDLAGALYKKAIGFETTEEYQDVEDNGKGKASKRKIHRVKKYVPPDYKAIIYLMTKTFGKEYSERYEELALAERKLEGMKEEWKADGVPDDVVLPEKTNESEDGE